MNIFAALSPTALFNGVTLLLEQYNDLSADPTQKHELLEAIKTSKLEPGYILTICDIVGKPEVLTFPAVQSPGALYIGRTLTSEPKGIICTLLEDSWKTAALADGGHPERRLSWIQPAGQRRADWRVDLPEKIWISRTESNTCLVFNVTAIEQIRSLERKEQWMVDVRAKVASFDPPLTFNAKGYDRMRKGGVVGSGAPGGLTAHGTDDQYIVKSSAQQAREEAEGGDREGTTANMVGVAFLARLFHYDYSRIRNNLLGPILNFKSPQLAGRVVNLVSHTSVAGILALTKKILPHLLSGSWTNSLTPADGESAVNGDFVALALQLFMFPEEPLKGDPKATQKKYVVRAIKDEDELKDVVERVQITYCALTGDNMLEQLFAPFLKQIYEKNNKLHPAKTTTLARLFALVSVRLGKWFAYAQIYYENTEDRPSPQEFFTASTEFLSLTADDIIADKNARYPVDATQFSNVFIPPVEKEKQPGGGAAPGAGGKKQPFQQEKGTKPNPPKKPKVDGVAPVVAAKPAGGNVPLAQQLCFNKFVGEAGLGPTCDKKPGMKGYPCLRNHNFSKPNGGAKWPVSILDAAEEAANKVRPNNIPLGDAVLAEIARLR